MKFQYDRPLAITMWDFSWLERRWPGAGYENWDQVLDELKERGYDAVRIDAYPHLMAEDPKGSWTLKPQWNQQDWGAPALVEIQRIEQQLLEFISLCRQKKLMVGLSTWFREDTANIRMKLQKPEDLAAVWKNTIHSVERAGLMDSILYVDICNEYPHSAWSPFLLKAAHKENMKRSDPESVRWAREVLRELKEGWPDLAFTVSESGPDMEKIVSELEGIRKAAVDEVEDMDFMEMHIWFTHFTDFYRKVGYHYERFSSEGYENMVKNAEAYYRSKQEYFHQELKKGILTIAQWSQLRNRPVITTECWGPVDYKDWPGLSWDWVKELCETGVETASKTGRWLAIATSNFCGPQFAGMWRDVAWHQRMTRMIHEGSLPRIAE